MIDLGPFSLFYRILKDLWTWIRGSQRRLSQSEITQARQKWKSEIEPTIWKRRKEGLGLDVIVHDVRRQDEYPDINEKKGISPWFKVGLMGTYHRGILAGLEWTGLTLDGDKWHRTDHQAGEKTDLTAILIGYIKYENIEAIDWDGDEYYSNPHFFCHFVKRRREPYEKLAYCDKRDLDDIVYYSELADYQDVKKNTKKRR